MFGMVFILLGFISCRFSLEISCFYFAQYQFDSKLNSYLIPLNTSLFYRGFLGFSRYLLTHSLIHRAMFLNFLFSRQKLDVFLDTSKSLAINTSSIPLDLSRFCSRHLLIQRCLDTHTHTHTHTLEVRPSSFHTQISLSLSLFLFSLDRNLFFSSKSSTLSRFQPIPSSNLLVSVLKLFYFFFLMHFVTQVLDFFGKFVVFVFLMKSLGWLLQ